MRAPKSFEDGMTRLEAILEQMQQPETTLAESVKLYAEAASLMDYCNGTLEKATLQLDEIDAQRAPRPAAASVQGWLPAGSFHPQSFWVLSSSSSTVLTVQVTRCSVPRSLQVCPGRSASGVQILPLLSCTMA